MVETKENTFFATDCLLVFITAVSVTASLSVSVSIYPALLRFWVSLSLLLHIDRALFAKTTQAHHPSH